jgi:hypothetical protein
VAANIDLFFESQNENCKSSFISWDDLKIENCRDYLLCAVVSKS